jgi:Tfp pilus assembly protein PilV
MTAVAWVIVWVGVLGVIGYVSHVSYARGYASGQHSERQALNRMLNEERQRALSAEHDIDYLYERARWQISRLGWAMAQSDRNDHA